MRLFSLALSAALVSVSTGCSHIVIPSAIPPLGFDVAPPMGSGAVALEADLSPAPLALFFTAGGNRFYADPPTWNSVFTADLAQELAKRGIAIGPGARNKGIVQVHSVYAQQGFWVVRVYLTVRITDGTGRIVYERQATEAGGNLERAANGALYQAKLAILGDPGFQGLLR